MKHELFSRNAGVFVPSTYFIQNSFLRLHGK